LSLARTLAQYTQQEQWPEGFFEQTAGCFMDESLECISQGKYEKNVELQ